MDKGPTVESTHTHNERSLVCSNMPIEGALAHVGEDAPQRREETQGSWQVLCMVVCS